MGCHPDPTSHSEQHSRAAAKARQGDNPRPAGLRHGYLHLGDSCQTDGQSCLGSSHPSLAHPSANTHKSLPWARWRAPAPPNPHPGEGDCATEAHGGSKRPVGSSGPFAPAGWKARVEEFRKCLDSFPVPCIKPFPLCLPGFCLCANCGWLLGLEQGPGSRDFGSTSRVQG